MPIRLHGIRPSLDRADAQDRRNRSVQGLHVIDIGRRLARRDVEQRAALLRLLPPIQRARGARVLVAKQLRPSRAENLVRADALNEPFMQLLHQTIALRLVDDEGEVQIIGGLGYQVYFLVLKQFESRSQLMQDAANVLAHKTQRAPSTQYFHPP